MSTLPTSAQHQFIKKLGYCFADMSLLTLALTHRSVHKSQNYERLEFLGDALLSTIIAEQLYQRFPSAPEGRLTRMRATLVRQQTLAIVARDLELGKSLNLGAGERKAGGRNRDSILADVVEAVIGAIYLDSRDLRVVQDIVLQWFAPHIARIDSTPVLKDAKSRLQELLQSRQLALPSYQLLNIAGKAPDEVFYVSCTASGVDTQIATGKSRRIAEQNAALATLTLLEELYS